MPDCVAIRHVEFEDLDAFTPVLEGRGLRPRYVEAAAGGLDGLDPLAPALLVVLGGPMGVYEEHRHPFLTAEFALVGRRLAAGLPTLGICLGAQIMARALGARVYPNTAKEIGWSPLELTSAGRASALAELADAQVLHWHGDTFDLPDGAVRLASTPLTPNQAFLAGGHALGLQFHMEATAEGLERWYLGHAAELDSLVGLTVPDLKAQAASHAEGAVRAGTRALDRWLAANRL